MAALAESLVDEWLNRQGFFTVRGLKHGVEEIDLLGVRPTNNGHEGWHVEVTVSFRPIGYISPLVDEYIPSFAKKPRSVKVRPNDVLERCVKAWVEGKYSSRAKQKARESAWPNIAWKHFLVHGVVKYEDELGLIASHGIKIIPLHEILSQLRHASGKLRGGAGTDLAEVVEYYNDHILRANSLPRG